MSRRMGENWHEDWDQVVEMACVMGPKNSQHQYHEAHAWIELFFELSFFSPRDQRVQLENLRRQVAELYSWVWGDRAEELTVLFDYENRGDRARQLEHATHIASMGWIGHLPPLRLIRTDEESKAKRAGLSSTLKWLKDCCVRVRNRGIRDRDRILHRNFEVTEYQRFGEAILPYFEAIDMYASPIDQNIIPTDAGSAPHACPSPKRDDEQRMEQAFEVFLSMLADEGFPTSEYHLNLAMFKEADARFRGC